MKAWNENSCEQVKEVVGMRDRCIGSVMSRSECDNILTFLYVQGSVWNHEIIYFIFCACTYANKEFQTSKLINKLTEPGLPIVCEVGPPGLCSEKMFGDRMVQYCTFLCTSSNYVRKIAII